MATRYVIRKGDGTSAGGVVLAGSGVMSGFGPDIAHEGDPVQCPTCNSIGHVVAFGQRWSMTGQDGERIALSGDLCQCMCRPLPTLLPGTILMAMNFDSSSGEADSGSSVPSTGSATVSPTSSSASALGSGSSFALGGAGADAGLQKSQIAASGVSEEKEAECHEFYERDLDECTAYSRAMGGARFLALCQQKAFDRYQQCRGY